MNNFIFSLANLSASQSSPQNVNPIINLLPIIVIFAIFYLLLIRPQQKRQKEHQQLISDLKKNDEIITVGGMHGTIVNVKDKTFILRVDENARIEVEKSSVATVKKTKSETEQEQISSK